MKGKIGSYINFIWNSIFVFLLIFLCFIFFSIYKGNIPYIFGYGVLRVVSSSMEPAIDEDDCIIIKRVKEENLKIGDVITFYSKDPYIYGYLNTHRINNILIDEVSGEKTYITKGDHNESADVYTVQFKDIVGRYERNLPGGRVISFFINKLMNQWVYFIVMIFPLLICFITSILSIIKEINILREEIAKNKDI